MLPEQRETAPEYAMRQNGHLGRIATASAGSQEKECLLLLLLHELPPLHIFPPIVINAFF